MNFVDAFTEHPILGLANDYPNGVFTASVSLELTGDDIVFDVAVAIESIVISSLIKDHAALLVIEVTCGRTFYRRHFSSFDLEFSFRENAAAFSGKLEMEVAVVSEKSISRFSSEEHHPDYHNAIINIDRGDVLAYAERLEHILDPITGDFVNNNSLVGVRSSFNAERPYNIDLSGDRIIVELPETTVREYFDSAILTSKRLAPLALSAIVQNALLTAIIALSSEEAENHADKIWYDVLTLRLKNETNTDEFDASLLTPERSAFFASHLVRHPILDLPKMITDLRRDTEDS